MPYNGDGWRKTVHEGLQTPGCLVCTKLLQPKIPTNLSPRSPNYESHPWLLGCFHTDNLGKGALVNNWLLSRMSRVKPTSRAATQTIIFIIHESDDSITWKETLKYCMWQKAFGMSRDFLCEIQIFLQTYANISMLWSWLWTAVNQKLYPEYQQSTIQLIK